VTSVLASEGDGRWLEYAGGYSDMLAQRRGAGQAAAMKPAKAAQSEAKGSAMAPAAAPAAPRRKLSFKEKHALQTLPGLIARLEADVASLNATIADPGLYARDAAAFSAASARLAAAQSELAAAEEQWLELEMLREELET